MATLKYKDKKDRAYGLTGMSVCMCLMDNEQYISNVDIDAEADCGLEFTPDFFHTRNQKLSAKAVWKGNLEHFRLITGLIVSNLMCRALVRNGEDISQELSELVLKHLQAEGAEMCSLDADETRGLFSESLNFFYRVFSHPQVFNIVEEFVKELSERRRLESDRVLYILRPLINM